MQRLNDNLPPSYWKALTTIFVKTDLSNRPILSEPSHVDKMLKNISTGRLQVKQRFVYFINVSVRPLKKSCFYVDQRNEFGSFTSEDINSTCFLKSVQRSDLRN